MQRLPTILFVLASVQAIVPGWTGDSRLPLLGAHGDMTATQVQLDPTDRSRTKLGGLTYLGGAVLRSRDPAFGGYSALAVDGEHFTLLSDGGNIVRFRMGLDWRPAAIAFSNLPGGPALGWSKRDRDSESLTLDPVTRRAWVGFEHWNAIGRYSVGAGGVPLGRFDGFVKPRAMADWPDNGGPESMVRLRDGRFVVIAETARPKPVEERLGSGRRGLGQRSPGRRGPGRRGLIFASDPLTGTPMTRPAEFVYLPPHGFNPADVTQLPDGRLLVLNRAFSLPFVFSNSLTILDSAAIREGAILRGREIARLAAPLVHDNFEGIAVTREGRDTIVWIVSDDNETVLERTLLLKFRLDR